MQVVEAGRSPFRWWRLADIVSPEMCKAAVAVIPQPDWMGWVYYRNDVESGKRTTRELFRPLMEIRRELAYGPPGSFLRKLANVSPLILDPEQHGAGLHVTGPGGWLQVHGDYEIHPRWPDRERRLNLILWLNETWRQQWGGALLLCDGTGATVRSFYPAFGEAVLFEAGPAAFHGAMQTSLDAPPRITLASYYLSTRRVSAVRRRAMFLPNRDAPNCPREVAIPKPV